VDKENVVHHNEVLLGHKNNEILPFAVTWMGTENIKMSEIDTEREY
jgi:hypothetical protein